MVHFRVFRPPLRFPPKTSEENRRGLIPRRNTWLPRELSSLRLRYRQAPPPFISPAGGLRRPRSKLELSWGDSFTAPTSSKLHQLDLPILRRCKDQAFSGRFSAVASVTVTLNRGGRDIINSKASIAIMVISLAPFPLPVASVTPIRGRLREPTLRPMSVVHAAHLTTPAPPLPRATPPDGYQELNV